MDLAHGQLIRIINIKRNYEEKNLAKFRPRCIRVYRPACKSRMYEQKPIYDSVRAKDRKCKIKGLSKNDSR